MEEIATDYLVTRGGIDIQYNCLVTTVEEEFTKNCLITRGVN